MIQIIYNNIGFFLLCTVILLVITSNVHGITDKTNPIATEKAIFAGGCFWCMEPPYDKLDGVLSTTSGYTGGHKENPTYEGVSAGITGHTEAVEIEYDPEKTGYAELLEIFWRNIDPTVKDRQFCDKGTQYRSGIYYLNEEQKSLAEQSKNVLENSRRFKTIHTEIAQATTFYPAEEYHQDYYKEKSDTV